MGGHGSSLQPMLLAGSNGWRMLLVVMVLPDSFQLSVPRGGGDEKPSPWHGIPSLIWHLAVPLEPGHPSSRTLRGVVLTTPWPQAPLLQDGFSQSCLFPPGLPRGSGPAMPHTAAVEYLQQKREPLRVYQDTAACRYVWGYCGKSQPPNRAGRVLEAPAETEHQQLLAQTCLCASHLAKMETELSPGFVSHIPKHNTVPAASLLAAALKSGATQRWQCGAPRQGPPCQGRALRHQITRAATGPQREEA